MQLVMAFMAYYVGCRGYSLDLLSQLISQALHDTRPLVFVPQMLFSGAGLRRRVVALPRYNRNPQAVQAPKVDTYP